MILEVPIAFMVWGGCRQCGNSTILFFAKGRGNTPADKWALPCALCRDNTIFYTSFAVTAN